MKLRLFKFGVIFALVIAVSASAVRAYFTSEVIAADNSVSTGNLILALDALNSLGNLVNLETEPFPNWIDAKPGDTKEYWLAMRNAGSMPFGELTLDLDGTWSLLPDGCVQEPPVITLTSTRVTLETCDAASACSALRAALVAGGKSPNYSSGLLTDQFALYQLDLDFDISADNCYQSGNYSFDLRGTATQILPPTPTPTP